MIKKVSVNNHVSNQAAFLAYSNPDPQLDRKILGAIKKEYAL